MNPVFSNDAMEMLARATDVRASRSEWNGTRPWTKAYWLAIGHGRDCCARVGFFRPFKIKWIALKTWTWKLRRP